MKTLTPSFARDRAFVQVRPKVQTVTAACRSQDDNGAASLSGRSPLKQLIAWGPLLALGCLLGCPAPANEVRCNSDSDCPTGQSCPTGVCEATGFDPAPTPDAGPSESDAGPNVEPDAGPGENDAGSDGGNEDGGAPDDGGLVENDAGVVVTDAGPGDIWWDTKWASRVSVQVTVGDDVTEDLVNVPVMMRLTAEQLPGTRDDFGDVRFVSSGGTLLDYEIEHIVDDAGTIFWVKLPLVSASVETSFFLYFGNPFATATPRQPNVWSEGYDGVWHLAGDLDNAADFVRRGPVLEEGATLSSDVLGGGLVLDGVDDFATLATSTTLGTEASALTVSMRIRSSAPTKDARLFSLTIAANSTYRSRMSVGTKTNGRLTVDARSDDDVDGPGHETAAGVLEEGTVYTVTGVVDFAANSVRIYVGGVEVLSVDQDFADVGPTTPSRYLRLGIDDGGTARPFAGDITEVTLSRVARSASWVAFQAAQFGASPVTLGPVETTTAMPGGAVPVPADDVFDADEDDGESTIDVLANDDNNGGDVFIVGVDSPSFGSLTIAPDQRSLIFRPSTNAFGTGEFNYIVSDGVDGVASGVLQIRVASVNDLPVAYLDRASVRVGESIVVDVRANDSDFETSGVNLVVAFDGGNIGANAVSVVDNMVQISAETMTPGNYYVDYTLTDEDAATTTSTVYVSVFDAPATLTFVDRSAAAGLTPGGNPYGIAMADFDGDGVLDIALGAGSIANIYRGTSAFEFAQFQRISGASRTMTFADVDNDGVLELFTTTGADLFAQDAQGVFAELEGAVDQTTTTNLGTTVWMDVDGDALLDLFLIDGYAPFAHVQRNLGTAVPSFAVADPIVVTGGPPQDNYETSTNADIDRDGDIDVIMLGDAEIYLLVNNGDGTFTEEAAARGLSGGINDPYVGVVFGDCDNDGDFDLFVGGSFEPMRLFKNNNGLFTLDNSFSFVTERSVGLTTGDVDNDGNLDVFVGVRRSNPFSKMTSMLLLNRGDCQFVDVASAEGIGVHAPTQTSGGALLVDLDRDGDLDLVQHGSTPLVFENNLDTAGSPNVQRNRSLRVVYRSTNPLYPRDGTGTIVEVIVSEGPVVIRTHVRAFEGGHGYGSQLVGEVHFGLGARTPETNYNVVVYRTDGTSTSALVDPDVSTVEGPYTFIITD